MAALVPGIACCVSKGKKTCSNSQNNLAFIRDKCCHLTMCLQLVEPHCYASPELSQLFLLFQYHDRGSENDSSVCGSCAAGLFKPGPVARIIKVITVLNYGDSQVSQFASWPFRMTTVVSIQSDFGATHLTTLAEWIEYRHYRPI